MNGAQLAVFLCGLIVIAAICAVWFLYAARDALRDGPHGRHAFADPADITDPDGTQYIAELHHERPAGLLQWTGTVDAATLTRVRDALHSWRPGPADTAPLPVAVCELGMPTEDYVDQLFAKYAEMTG